MKLKISTNTSRLALAMFLVGGVTFFTGCSTVDKNETENISPENLSSIRVNVTTEVMQEDLPEAPKVGKASAGTALNIGYQGNVEEHETYDAKVSFGNTSTSQKASASTAVRTNAPKAATLTPGVQYRVLLYNTNGTLAQNKVAISGQPLAIDVVKGATYNWVAYSYNKDANTSLPDITDAANPTVSTGENVDLLHATGTISIPTTSGTITTALNINFAHKLRRIAVQLNTEGMFADLTAGSVTFDDATSGNFFEKATFNLKTGAIVPSTNSTFTVPTVTAFERTAGHGFDDRNVFYFYTAKTDAITNAKVKINSFSIKLDDASTRNFTTAATMNPFTIPAISALGKSQMPNVDLIESAITVGGVRWARANIYYHPTITHNRYRFHHLNVQTNMRNSFWPWHGLTPDNNTGTGDPCRQVYPIDTWRTPNPAELTTLRNTTPTYKTTSPRNISYAGTGVSAPYPNGNTLTFPQNGEGGGLELLGISLIPFNVSDAGARVHLWSDDPTIDLLNLVNVGVTFYNGRNQNVPLVGERQSTDMTTTLITDVTLLGINVLQSGYKNIRCVRN